VDFYAANSGEDGHENLREHVLSKLVATKVVAIDRNGALDKEKVIGWWVAGSSVRPGSCVLSSKWCWRRRVTSSTTGDNGGTTPQPQPQLVPQAPVVEPDPAWIDTETRGIDPAEFEHK